MNFSCSEFVMLRIHLAKVTKDVIEVLAIHILPLLSNGCNNHALEIKTSALRKVADSNSVDLLVGFHSELKRDYGSKTKERKNSDTKDRSFDVTCALPLVAMLSCWGVCIPPNRLAITGCRINVRIGRARVIKDRCLKKVGQREHTPR
jgi:hypothetical protein